MKQATRIGWIFIVLITLAAPAFSQVKWIADANSAEIPSGNASGNINGSRFVSKYGRLAKTGHTGSDDVIFEHFTITLRDADDFWSAKFSVTMTVTVKKGEFPDGKTFRKLPKHSLDASQPSLGDKSFRVPEFLSLDMSGPAEFPAIGKILSSSAEMFSGVVTLGARKDGRIPVGLYVCFNDEQKSCVAGKTELEVLETKDQ